MEKGVDWPAELCMGGPGRELLTLACLLQSAKCHQGCRKVSPLSVPDRRPFCPGAADCRPEVPQIVTRGTMHVTCQVRVGPEVGL